MSVAIQKGGILDFAMILIAGGVGAILTQLDNEVIHWEFVVAGVLCILLGSFMPVFREWWKPRWHMAEELEKVDVFRDKIIEHMSPDKERPDIVVMEESDLPPAQTESQVDQAVELSKETDKTVDASTLTEEEEDMEEWYGDNER